MWYIYIHVGKQHLFGAGPKQNHTERIGNRGLLNPSSRSPVFVFKFLHGPCLISRDNRNQVGLVWMDRGPTKCYHILTHILHESPRLKDTLEVESHDVSPDPRKETGNVGKEMGGVQRRGSQQTSKSKGPSQTEPIILRTHF